MSFNRWPDTTRVEHAGFTADLSRAAVRNITYQGAQIIDLLYTAIRLVDWSTLDPDQHTEDVQKTGDTCTITIVDGYESTLRGRTILTLSPNGKFSVSYELQSAERIELNRWGVCFCLDTADWAAGSVTSLGESLQLPKNISPQARIAGVTQGLFPASYEMHLSAIDGRSIRVHSTGNILEAEDQRNWTDNTFKIYSGSLSESLPIVIEPRLSYTQSVEFEVTPPRTPLADGAKILVKELSSFPRIGLQFNEESSLSLDELERALTILDVDHIRINEESLNDQKISTTSNQGLLLEVALLSSNEGEVFSKEVETLSAKVPAGSRLLIHRAGRRVVEAKDLPKNDSLNTYIPGSDAYLVDLHRDKREYGDSVSYSMAPTVHSFDLESIFKTLYTQEESIEFAKQQIAPQVSISPITLSIRGNPEADHSRDLRNHFANAEMAALITTIEAAAWTLGSVFSLASAAAFSGTWHELFGEFGIIYDHNGVTKFSPTFHAFAALGAHHSHEITIATCVDRSWVGFEDREAKKMVIASLCPWNLEIASKVLAGYTSLQSLRRESVDMASEIMDWWSYTEATPIQSDRALALAGFEITLLRG